MSFVLSAVNPMEIERIAFRIGNLEVAWYGLLIVLGMLTGLLIVLSQCKRIRLTTDDAIEFFLWVIPLAVIFARLLFVMVRPDDYFDPQVWEADSTQAFIDMIAIWDGGITIIGGILGGFIGVVIFSIRKRDKANFGQVLDLIVTPLLVGQLFGRVGNFINQEAFGLPITDPKFQSFPFGVLINTPSGVGDEFKDVVYDHISAGGGQNWFCATFFYEMCWNAVGASIAFIVWRKNKKYPGILAFFYFFWYFLGRGLLEFVRIDAVPITQVASFILVPVALVLGVLYILLRENQLAFRKVNNSFNSGTIEAESLTNWEINNYLFGVKWLKKSSFVAWKLYGVDSITVAKISPKSKK